MAYVLYNREDGTVKDITVTVKIKFSELDRRIIAFARGLEGEVAERELIEGFVRSEIEHALEFLGSDYQRLSVNKRHPQSMAQLEDKLGL